ncbi:MAG: hypothetical protein ACI9Z7_000112 [Alteromonas macleodii]|jgi:hypothetical protein
MQWLRHEGTGLTISKLMKKYIRPRCVLLLFSILGCQVPNEKISSDEQLAQINYEIPILEYTDTIEFANNVRRFVATKANAGNLANNLCDTFYRIPIRQFPVNTYLNIFDSLKGASSCGLTSYMMTKILLDNGIDAYTYNFGFEKSDVTHVVTLVKHHNDFLIFDAHSNFELIDSAGFNIGLLSLLKTISKGKGLVPIFYSDTVSAKFILDTEHMSKNELRLLQTKEFAPIYSNLDTLGGKILMTDYDKCFECDLNPMGIKLKKSFERKLSEETRYRKFHEAFALKINSVVGAADSDSVDRVIEARLLELGLR